MPNMNRRGVMSSLAALGLVPLVPGKALAALSPVGGSAATTRFNYQWAETLVRAHGTGNLAMLQRHLKVDQQVAAALHQQLVRNGVLAAQADAYGAHRAVRPLYDAGFFRDDSATRQSLKQALQEDGLNTASDEQPRCALCDTAWLENFPQPLTSEEQALWASRQSMAA